MRKTIFTLAGIAIICAILFLIRATASNCELKINRKILGQRFERKIRLPVAMETPERDRLREPLPISQIKGWPKAYMIHVISGTITPLENQMRKIEALIRHKRNIHFIFIADAKSKAVIEEARNTTAFPYSFYYEHHTNDFLKINQLPLTDPTLKTLLLDYSGALVAKGDFFGSKKVQEHFAHTIECIAPPIDDPYLPHMQELY